SKLSRGFVRTKTILGRRLLYCHPPRLEGMVRVNVERLKKGEEYREYWTKQGDRIIRVLVVAVRSESGEYLGTLEIVEDLTEVVKNPDEVMKKLVVL
ncbi:MAG: PAS domain-containing protein, partial [Zestosphaera sp.]